jgi:hypothetical protein
MSTGIALSVLRSGNNRHDSFGIVLYVAFERFLAGLVGPLKSGGGGYDIVEGIARKAVGAG